MLDQLREAFPQIDWSEGDGPHAKVPLVDGPLKEEFHITVFHHTNGPPPCMYSANLYRGTTLPSGYHERNRRPVLCGGRLTFCPVKAVRGLLEKSVTMGEAIDAVHSRFLSGEPG